MQEFNSLVSVIALTMGVAWASGINLYAAILVLGLLDVTGNIALPDKLAVVSDPIVLSVAGVLFLVEFFADKIPGVDSGWDAVQTFIRVPLGAVLAAGAVGEVSPPLMVAAGMVGASIAGVTHATKAGSRVLINSSPEPFSNWIASLSEDVLVILGLWTALHHPVLFLALFALFTLTLLWLLPKIWRGVLKIFGLLKRLFTGNPPSSQRPIALPGGINTSGINTTGVTPSGSA